MMVLSASLLLHLYIIHQEEKTELEIEYAGKVLGLERGLQRRDDSIDELSKKVLASEKALDKMAEHALAAEENIR